jgi:hypothetical protein
LFLLRGGERGADSFINISIKEPFSSKLKECAMGKKG